MSDERSELLYAYAVVPSALLARLDDCPPGVDDRAVAAVEGDGLAVLVSTVDGAAYAPAVVEAAAASMDWLGPRAAAHDRVVTWASDLGTVIPLPVLSLFHEENSVRRLLGERDAELRSTAARVAGAREYGVRVAQDEARMASALATVRPRIAAMEAEAAAAPPGQAYLIRRKLEGARRTEMQELSAAVARGTWDRLHAHAREALVLPLPPVAAAAERLVLDAVFLVDERSLDDFRTTLTEIIGEHGEAGFGFAFTGPWPPYHFVRDPAAETETTAR